MRTCPSCGEEWATTVPVCTCGTNLAGDGRRSRRWRPSRRLLLTILGAVAVVPGVIVLTLYLLPDGTVVPGGIDVPDRGREARLDELPDRRARPNVTCEGTDVAADCMVWTFTLPRSASLGFAMARSDDAVLIRDAGNVWLLDLATGEERWQREITDSRSGIEDVWLVGSHAIIAGTTGFEVLDGATGDHLLTRRLDGRLIRIGADDERVITATTRDVELVVTAWDPNDASVLWESTISAHGPVEDVSLSLGGPGLPMPDDHLIVSITTSLPHQLPQHQTVALARGTGEQLGDLPEPDRSAVPGRFDDSRVILEGTQLRGEDTSGTIAWERELPSPFVHVQPLAGDRAALIPQDFTRITVIDAATGDELFHIHGNNSRLLELPFQPPWVVAVRTADAQHIVLLDLPLS